MSDKINVNAIMKELEGKLRKGLSEGTLDATGISRLIGEHLEKTKEKVIKDTHELIREEAKPYENESCGQGKYDLVHIHGWLRCEHPYRRRGWEHMAGDETRADIPGQGYNQEEERQRSGMIESGNKIVVQKRMRQAGMRWGIDGAQYIAVLRAKHESNRWNEVEKFIYGKSKVA